ncbi:SOS response-associated peptidase [Syntrophothermus sp.]|uniref:SOS response-associated peptidase n=1 Tax=Syntrophothermus sp. TaxID=2736299 RepID=UPI00257C1C8A|nr:SOS response-associated peptidase [Syntrophothermus sp.]
MCGRFTLTADRETIADHFHVDVSEIEHQPRYNIAPGQPVPVISGTARERKITMMRWGLIPRWAKDVSIGNKLINARAETIDKKPAFRESFLRQRCLVPADGFFEWKKDDGNKKIPFRIVLPDRKLFAFAGIWDSWVSPTGIKVDSFSVITVEASGDMVSIHERMPAILADEEMQALWLNYRNAVELKRLLVPYAGQLKAYKVSPLVNSPVVDDPRCVAIVQ